MFQKKQEAGRINSVSIDFTRLFCYKYNIKEDGGAGCTKNQPLPLLTPRKPRLRPLWTKRSPVRPLPPGAACAADFFPLIPIALKKPSFLRAFLFIKNHGLYQLLSGSLSGPCPLRGFREATPCR